jgi:hypothetical protein
MDSRPQLGLFDVSRGRRNSFSRKAWEVAKPKVQGRKHQILEWIRAAGSSGLTSAEAAERLGTQVHNVSGRFSELAFEEKIEQSSDARKGFGVWRAK